MGIHQTLGVAVGWAKEGRSYPTEQGGVWSSTTILGMKDKSGPLTYWAANQCADYIKSQLGKHGSETDGYITIAKPMLTDILAMGRKAFRYAKEEAADIGTEVHRLIEAWCKGYEWHDIEDSRVENAFNLFLGWAEEVDLQPLLTERKVFSLRHEYGGTFDMVASGRFKKKWRKKRTYLIDTKTSKAIYDTFMPQVASYSEAYIERAIAGDMPRHKLDGEAIIRVGKEDGEYEFVDCSAQHEESFRKFLALKDAYIAWNGRPK